MAGASKWAASCLRFHDILVHMIEVDRRGPTTTTDATKHRLHLPFSAAINSDTCNGKQRCACLVHRRPLSPTPPNLQHCISQLLTSFRNSSPLIGEQRYQ